MKKFKLLALMAAVFLVGSTQVHADGYWEEHFKDRPVLGYTGCGYGSSWVTEWKNISKNEYVIYGGCGDSSSYATFIPLRGTSNLVFTDVNNVSAVSSNTDVINVEVKPYDFSSEKENYNNYVTEFNAATYDEFIQNYCMKDNNVGFYDDEAKCKEKYPTKPTWWSFSEYETEPDTWWKAYNLASEPTSAVEVITYAKDLGKANVTLKADGKSDITISWTVKAFDFGSTYEGLGSSEGLIQILNNLEKYQEVIPDTKSFSYYIFDDEDLSGVINALKGKDITINFIQYSLDTTIEYPLKGTDIKEEVAKGFTYAHGISMETSVNKDKIDKLVDLKNAIYIDFAYHGALPAPYIVEVDLNDYLNNLIYNEYFESFYNELKCADYIDPAFKKYQYGDYEYDYEGNDQTIIDKLGKYNQCKSDAYSKVTEKAEDYLKNSTFDLLYYNPETNKMEKVFEKLTATDGIIKLSFDHFSSYVLVPTGSYQDKPPVVEEKPDTPNVPNTYDNMPIYLSIALIGTAGLAISIPLLNKKKGTK